MERIFRKWRWWVERRWGDKEIGDETISQETGIWIWIINTVSRKETELVKEMNNNDIQIFGTSKAKKEDLYD